jgi:hypothetical protein
MLPSNAIFDRSIARQIAINRARTPTERLEALCDLLDAARALAPRTEEAAERRRRALEARQAEREKLRATWGRLLSAERAKTATDGDAPKP